MIIININAMFRPTVLITGVGGGGSNNLIRGLQSDGFDGRIIGSNVSKYYLAKSPVKENYLLPRGDQEGYEDALKTVIRKEGVDLIIPNNGTEVRAVSKLRRRLPTNVFLPPHCDIKLCQDKFELSNVLDEAGVPVAESRVVENLDEIPAIFEDLDSDMVWCRLRRGSGSKGATKVRTPSQARHWIEYWEDMREIDRGEFTLNEYLPGRDYAFQSLWKDGELVLSKALERLSYYFGDNRASGQSSTPQVGKLLYDEKIQETCERAIQTVNKNATGLYAVDLKENENGVPHVTEINIGRFFMITNAFNEVGQYNMGDVYIKLGMGENPSIQNRRRDIGNEATYLIRELDTEPLLVTESELKDKYDEVT
jgi:carbamoyl-phosphate synthase large subunit